MARRRKRIKVTDEVLRRIRRLARIGCTKKEIARKIGCHQVSLSRGKLCDAYEQGRVELAVLIRSLQIRYAKRGNATLLIWLSKVILGQKDDSAQLARAALQEVKEIIIRQSEQQLQQLQQQLPTPAPASPAPPQQQPETPQSNEEPAAS